MEYFQLCTNSEAIKTSEISNYIIGSGLTALDHIFSLSYSITKDLDASAKYVNRGNSYFHEYLDQLNRTGMIQSVDCTDIVKFVYSKTVSEIYAGKSTSILPLTQKQLISPHIVGTILWCSNTEISCLQRHEIAYLYLLPVLEFVVGSDVSPETLNVISDLQEWNPKMKYEDYVVLLAALVKYMKKITKDKTTIQQQNEAIRETRIYMITNWKHMSLAEIVECEGYKNIGDIILK